MNNTTSTNNTNNTHKENTMHTELSAVMYVVSITERGTRKDHYKVFGVPSDFTNALVEVVTEDGQVITLPEATEITKGELHANSLGIKPKNEEVLGAVVLVSRDLVDSGQMEEFIARDVETSINRTLYKGLKAL